MNSLSDVQMNCVLLTQTHSSVMFQMIHAQNVYTQDIISNLALATPMIYTLILQAFKSNYTQRNVTGLN